VRCPVGWTDIYGGYWVATGYEEVFELGRHPSLLSNDRDVKGERKGYLGISIPPNLSKPGPDSWRWTRRAAGLPAGARSLSVARRGSSVETDGRGPNPGLSGREDRIRPYRLCR
jgi:hypothetical protein